MSSGLISVEKKGLSDRSVKPMRPLPSLKPASPTSSCKGGAGRLSIVVGAVCVVAGTAAPNAGRTIPSLVRVRRATSPSNRMVPSRMSARRLTGAAPRKTHQSNLLEWQIESSSPSENDCGSPPPSCSFDSVMAPRSRMAPPSLAGEPRLPLIATSCRLRPRLSRLSNAALAPRGAIASPSTRRVARASVSSGNRWAVRQALPAGLRGAGRRDRVAACGRSPPGSSRAGRRSWAR